jgi:hypothetical protein
VINDARGLTRDQLRQNYRQELQRLLAMRKTSGGDFFQTQSAQLGKRFARAVIVSTLEGQTLYRDAFQLLGFSKSAAFDQLGHRLGLV